MIHNWRHTHGSTIDRPGFYARDVSQTLSLEEKRAKGLDTLLVLEETAESFERKLSIHERWTPSCDEWLEAEERFTNREYHRILNELEGLVVSRLFELAKRNQAGTG